MKKSLMVIAALISFNSAAELNGDKQFKYTGDVEFAKCCQAVVTDDLRLLKSSLSRKVGVLAGSRKDVLNLLIDEGMTCNGSDLIEFSKQRDADDVHAYLVAKS